MPDLVVVPSPLRRARAARRLCDANGGLLLGSSVVTPRQIVPGLLAAAGERRAVLAPLAERLLAEGAAREAGLGDGGAGVAGTAGTARAAARVVAELRRGEVLAARIEAAAAEAPGRAGERLRAAARALRLYEERLEGCGATDAAGAMRAAAAAAGRGALPEELRRPGLLVLEGRLPASPALLDLLGALAARSRRVLARIPWFPGDPGRSWPVEPWVRRIEALHEGGAGEVSISFPVEPPASRRVLGFHAGDDEAQVEEAARIAGEILDEGMAADDVAVVAPGRLGDALARAFGRAGIPLAVGVGEPLESSGLARDLRAALSFAVAPAREAAELLLSSPWLGVAEPPPRLGYLLDRAGALPGRGDPEERLRGRAASLAAAGPAGRERASLLEAADALAAARRSLAPLASPARPRAWAGRLRAFLERAGARRRAARGELALARRDLEVVARVADAADDLCGALESVGRGTEPLDTAAFAGLLDLALSSTALPAGGKAAAGAVELWPLEEAPGLEARAALVLGVERGAWPPPPPADPILGEGARQALQRHLRRRAVPTAAQLHEEAEHAAVAALAAGREILAVGWTSGDDGAGPSPLAAEALGAAPRRRAGPAPLASARTADEVLRAAARAWREGAALPGVLAAGGTPPADGDLGARLGSVVARGARERERRSAWLEGRAAPGAGGLEGVAGDAWRASLPAEWSASHLETHARCPYRFFLGASGLRDPDEAGLDMARRDEGSLLHAVLEAFFRDRRDRGAGPLTGDPAEAAEARATAIRVLHRFVAEGRVGDPAAWEARRGTVLSRLARFVAAEAAAADGLGAKLIEHRFGGPGGAPPVVVPAPGGEIRLAGRIDRVDADARRLLVIDYKDSSDDRGLRERLSGEALGVTSFQAPLYLLAAAQALPGRDEMAATYALLRSARRVAPWVVPPGEGFLALGEERRAEVRAAGGRTFADGVAEAVGRIRSGALPIAPDDCRGCPFGTVCRFPQRSES